MNLFKLFQPLIIGLSLGALVGFVFVQKYGVQAIEKSKKFQIIVISAGALFALLKLIIS